MNSCGKACASVAQWVQASEGHAIGSIHNWAPTVLLLSFFIPQIECHLFWHVLIANWKRIKTLLCQHFRWKLHLIRLSSKLMHSTAAFSLG